MLFCTLFILTTFDQNPLTRTTSNCQSPVTFVDRDIYLMIFCVTFIGDSELSDSVQTCIFLLFSFIVSLKAANVHIRKI